MAVTTSAGAPNRSRPQLPPRARKVVLTVHVIASVAWIGATLCLLALSLTGLLSRDPQVQRAAYVALGTIVTVVGAPVSIAALVSGIMISVGTRWGLFRHWWVLVSLVATAVMTAAVLFALGPLMRGAAADALAAPPGTPVLDAVGDAAVSAVVAPCVALVALSAITALNVFKPRGRVRFRASRA
ncbi:hypothetical protein FHX42_004598 [Saccharopolyspora lacisalsi]|uniref:DUF2269 domain-containing protein n=1 Tax=Halosaccharopolyspora lacisalsi TaxID=1000566 RepID=A0A839E0D7_9PSEU|nr:hypothetical protein [Halosaccharopolyspora lacisalsi]MBA8827214.1 hypothetical protein [Halosaccharopolyspora lacisalsi]